MENISIFTTEKSKLIRMSICRSATYVSTSCYLSRGYLRRIKFNQLTITWLRTLKKFLFKWSASYKANMIASFIELQNQQNFRDCYKNLAQIQFFFSTSNAHIKRWPNDSLGNGLYFCSQNTQFTRFYLRFPQFLGAWRVPLRGL